MENQQKVPQEIIKKKKSHWAIGIFFIQFILVFTFLILFANYDFSVSEYIYLIPIFGVILMFIFSIILFIKSKKEGRIYNLVDIIITLIMPVFICALFANLFL